MKKYLKIQFATALLVVYSFQSCTKGFEELNRDPTKPTAVTPALLITGIEKTASDIMYNQFVNINIGNLYAQYYSQTQNE